MPFFVNCQRKYQRQLSLHTALFCCCLLPLCLMTFAATARELKRMFLRGEGPVNSNIVRQHRRLPPLPWLQLWVLLHEQLQQQRQSCQISA